MPVGFHPVPADIEGYIDGFDCPGIEVVVAYLYVLVDVYCGRDAQLRRAS